MKHLGIASVIFSCITLVCISDCLAQQSTLNVQLPKTRRQVNTRNVQQMPTNRRQAAVGQGYRVPAQTSVPQARVRVRPGYSNWQLGVNTTDAPLGLRIVNVVSWTPGYYAGLEPDDYILDVNGYPVGSYANGYFPLQAAFAQLADPNGWVELAVWNHRDRQEQYMWVQLTQR